jgi:hypothetical protein
LIPDSLNKTYIRAQFAIFFVKITVETVFIYPLYVLVVTMPGDYVVGMTEATQAATDAEPILALGLFAAFVLAREANEKRKAATA